MKLKIETIGGFTRVILPEHLVARLNLQESQWVYATELPNGGGLRLAPNIADALPGMLTAGESMDESRET